MLQLVLESIQQVFTALVCITVYWFLWVVPAYSIGQSFIARLQRKPLDLLSAGLNLALFIIFAFPTILVIVLFLRYFSAST